MSMVKMLIEEKQVRICISSSKGYLETNRISLENLIGFASDGASNITGIYNSVVSRLTVDAPGITVLKCICHSAHLCTSQAAKTLP